MWENSLCFQQFPVLCVYRVRLKIAWLNFWGVYKVSIYTLCMVKTLGTGLHTDLKNCLGGAPLQALEFVLITES